ncbi:MAG: acyl carrier protein [Oscillospiraceae bacterium]|nr:acyl carrier protein [Oscillospiraceae bacterium]
MILKKIKEIISQQLGIDPDEITLESSFVDDLGADSIDMVELVMAMESEFDIEIVEKDAENIQTVSDAVEYIKKSIGE